MSRSPQSDKEAVTEKLLPFQVIHVENLVRILQKNRTVLDASDTGTGKTYTAIATCKLLKLRPMILCPKSVMSTWFRVARYFDHPVEFVVNYETIRLGKYYSKNRDRILCPYISVIVETDEDGRETTSYKWNLETEPGHGSESRIFIFDEVHKCGNLETHNGKLLYSANLTGRPIMILSATVADRADKFKLFFWVLNFLDPQDVARKKIGFDQYMGIIARWILRDQSPMLRIYNMLYPNRATRMRIDSLGDLFPETQIVAEAFNMGKSREEEIERQYSIIAEELDNLKDRSKRDKANSLVRMLRAHQKIEMLKVPTLVELANDFIENGYYVVIFVNFTQTLKLLAKMLNTTVLVYGEQTQEERDVAIQLFNDNETNIIICNMKTAPGISLHDTRGGFPRASLLSPTWNAVDLIQALGRVHRAGGKSKSLQRIVYTANTVEERIADNLKAKLTNVSQINDGDLSLRSATKTAVFFKPKF